MYTWRTPEDFIIWARQRRKEDIHMKKHYRNMAILISAAMLSGGTASVAFAGPAADIEAGIAGNTAQQQKEASKPYP